MTDRIGQMLSPVSSPPIGARRFIRRPSGFDDHVSRREAAALLGFASEFKVRQLEKQGQLVPVRGVMGSAWYPRAAVLALRERPALPSTEVSPAAAGGWSDAALINHLRRWTEADPSRRRPPTTVDLVAETGIPIARAERVFRFWVTRDLHPAAEAARGAARPPANSAPAKTVSAATATVAATPPKPPSERRSRDRLERDALLREMKHPDPRVRAAAFARLKGARKGG